MPLPGSSSAGAESPPSTARGTRFPGAGGPTTQKPPTTRPSRQGPLLRTSTAWGRLSKKTNTNERASTRARATATAAESPAGAGVSSRADETPIPPSGPPGAMPRTLPDPEAGDGSSLRPPDGRPSGLASGEAAGRRAGSAAGAAARNRAGEGRELLLDVRTPALGAGDPFGALPHAPQHLEPAATGRATILVQRHLRSSRPSLGGPA